LIPEPHPEHLPFLRAIVANPQDDLVRLVYADFLEESGDPNQIARAHYIRAQIEIENLPTGTPEFVETSALLARIEDMFMDQFQLELPVDLVEYYTIAYRRGFLDSVRLPIDEFQLIGKRLFDAYPILGLHINQPVSMLMGLETNDWFDRYPFIARLTSLGFGQNFYFLAQYDRRIGEVESGETLFFQNLMTTRNLAQLRSLNLSSNRITDDWLVRFVSRLERASFADSLRELNFTDCLLITNAGANTLATARSLEQLEILNLKNIQFSNATRDMLRRRFGHRVVF